MRRVRALCSAPILVVPFVALACATPPAPTSTTPATQGSAPILPSPSRAETVPREDVTAPTEPPPPVAPQPSAQPSTVPSVTAPAPKF